MIFPAVKCCAKMLPESCSAAGSGKQRDSGNSNGQVLPHAEPNQPESLSQSPDQNSQLAVSAFAQKQQQPVDQLCAFVPLASSQASLLVLIMPRETRADLIAKMIELGETPPLHWTVMQLKARLAELRALMKDRQPLTSKSRMAEVNKAAKKKSSMVAWPKRCMPASLPT